MIKSLKFIVQTEQTPSAIEGIFGFVRSTYRRSLYILIERKKKRLSLKGCTGNRVSGRARKITLPN